MKKLLILLLALMPIYGSAHISDLDISGNLTLGSDYLWRGSSQKGSTALSASVDIEHGGFYTGAWISEVDYGDNSEYELDFYSGYSYNFNDELSLDLGVIQYNFNDEPDNQLEEWYIGGSFKNFSAYYWRDMHDKTNHFAEYSFALPLEFLDISFFWQDPVDFYGINIGKSFEYFTIVSTYGQGRDDNNHEFVIGISYDF